MKLYQFLFLCVGIIAIPVTLSVVYAWAMPRLEGHGCVGTTGVIYADEEDHFPECQVIQRFDVIRKVFK